MFIWIQMNDLPNSNNNNILKTIFGSLGNDLWVAIEFFCLQGEAFHFSNIHKNVVKLDKGNLSRDLNMTFKVKNLWNYW